MTLNSSERSELVFRGKELSLNYTHGSPCESRSSGRSLESLEARETHSALVTRRKSTTISLICDADLTDPRGVKVALSFVGTDEDECAYFFKAKSASACAGIETTPQQLGPGGVFAVM